MTEEKPNVVLVDVIVNENWEFFQSLTQATKLNWIIKCWDNAGLMTNKLKVIKRYLGYFFHSLYIFLKRKSFNTVLAWQQFYGIIFAFYCEIFKVKKQNSLVILTFIYKKKNGFAGRLYHWFVSKAVCSKYIDKIVVYSQGEINYYSQIFNVPENKFTFMPFGLDKQETDLERSKLVSFDCPFLLSVGKSNRDYNFLIKAAERIQHPIVVLTDQFPSNVEIPDNITLFENIRGIEYSKLLNDCYAMLIPLKDENLSSGQMVMLKSMQFKKPVIVTESNAISDYAVNGVNAIVCKKDVNEFSNAVEKLFTDKVLYKNLQENGIKFCNEKYSQSTLGKNVGALIESIVNNR